MSGFGLLLLFGAHHKDLKPAIHLLHEVLRLVRAAVELLAQLARGARLLRPEELHQGELGVGELGLGHRVGRFGRFGYDRLSHVYDGVS